MRESLNNRINVRITDSMRDELEDLYNKTGISPADLSRKCLESVLAYWNENGEIKLPFKLIPESELPEIYLEGTKGKVSGSIKPGSSK
ncbi:MAG: hypothetical protein Q7Q73_02300 [Verrucomicrobiota bacterium JB024]|nr:hypothetical protein [Verrucomicrobiota bacterium JB024]